MAVKESTISLPADLAERIRELADNDGLPVAEWMAAAAKQMTGAEDRARRDAAWQELMATLEEENGPITEEERLQALVKWPE